MKQQLLYKPLVRQIDAKEMQARLIDENVPDDVVEELCRFGGIVINEIQQRRNALDQKLNSLLGWATAALALLLTRGDSLSKLSGAWQFVLVVATIASLSAVVFSAWGLKSRVEPVPSERDWFLIEDNALSNAERMKKYHAISMLKTHQAQNELSIGKAKLLRYSEISLAITGLAIVISLLALLR